MSIKAIIIHQKLSFFLPLFLVFILTSCFEIKEEIIINKKGNGSYKMTFHFSEESSFMEKLISRSEKEGDTSIQKSFKNINDAFYQAATDLNEIIGIKNAKSIEEDNYTFGLQFDFDDVAALNIALAQTTDANGNLEFKSHYKFHKKTLTRTDEFNLNRFTDTVISKKEEKEGGISESINLQFAKIFETAKYTFIVKTSGKIKSYTNLEARISYNKKELIYSKSLKELKTKKSSLANTIRIK